jgi:hypothetical protein
MEGSAGWKGPEGKRDQENGGGQKERGKGTSRMKRSVGKRDQEDCQGDQRGTKRMEGTRRKEGPGGLLRRPREKRVDKVGQKERETKRKEEQEYCQGDQEKRGTNRIAKGTKGTKRMEGVRSKERPRGLPRVPAEKRDQQDGGGQKERVTKRIAKGTSRMEGTRKKERLRGLPIGPGEKRDQ